jgi:hypothetical protein
MVRNCGVLLIRRGPRTARSRRCGFFVFPECFVASLKQAKLAAPCHVSKAGLSG